MVASSSARRPSPPRRSGRRGAARPAAHPGARGHVLVASLRPTLLALLALFAAASAVVWWWSSEGAAAMATPTAVARFVWPAGTVYDYDLVWSAQQEHRLLAGGGGPDAPTQAQNIEGSLNVAGRLRVRSYGPRSEGWVLGISLPEVDQLTWRVLDEEVLTVESAAELFGAREVFVEVDGRGSVQRSHFAAGTPEPFEGLMQWLVPHLQVVLPETAAEWDEGRWSARERNAQGTSVAEYTRDGLTLHRIRPVYEELHGAPVGSARVESADDTIVDLVDEGHLGAVRSRVLLQVAEAGKPLLRLDETFQLRLVSAGQAPRLGLALEGADLHSYAPDEPVQSTSAMAKAMANRVGDLTVASFLRDVRAFAGGGRLEHRWMWQATGLLALHPEACAELVPLFESAAMSVRGRGLLLDLLASTGTPEAQAALRTMLQSAAAQGDPDEAAVLHNRVALIDEVNPETAAFARQRYEEHIDDEGGPMKVASTYALGAVASHQQAQGETEAAAELNDLLVDRLRDARSPDEEALMLGALGNAGREDNIPEVLDHAQSPERTVRAAAATALRKTKTDDTVEALLGLLRDPDWQVQQAALSTLSNYPLSTDEVRRIEQLVLEGVVSPSCDPLVVTVLARAASPEAPFLEGLRFVLERNRGNGQLAARIRTVARRLGVTL